MNRQEHMAWAKQRALEYVAMGDMANAWASMKSDLGKHPETQDHAGILLGDMQFVAGQLSTHTAMRKFIEGFN